MKNNLKLLNSSIILFTLSVLCIFSAPVWSCPLPPPVAVLDISPDSAVVGQTVLLDGSDSFPGSGYINKCEWDFTNNGSYDYYETPTYYPDGDFDRKTTHIYTEANTYTAKLRVWNSYGYYDTDTDTCEVYVIQTYYVSTDGNDNNNGLSWPTAFATIQRGLNEANDYDVVDVNEGTYYETIDFNGISCTLTSTDPNDWDVTAKTIIDGNDPNADVVTLQNSEDAYCQLKGFTITGGARGIYCNGASPAISNCVITDNNSSGDGGGIYDCNSSLAITNCFIFENDANLGGGIYNSNSSPTLTNCVFSDNTAYTHGGGIYNDNSSPKLTNCTFSKNDAKDYGGGIYNYDSVSVLTNCIIWDNTAGDGNSIYYYDINYPSDQNFISWWKFDETSGTTAEDSVGDNNGTLNGDPNWVTGIIDGALSFDGVDDYVAINGVEIHKEVAYSIIMWVRGAAQADNRVYSEGSSTNNDPLLNIGSHHISTSKARFIVRDDNGIIRLDAESIATAFDSTWHQIAWVDDNGNYATYIDGVADVSGSYTKNAKTLDRTTIGAFGRIGYSCFFDGTIDDVRIYNRALNADEILALTSCVRYSDIQGSGGSSGWDPNFGIDGGGNIDSDPCFVNAADPNGNDNIFGTFDDGLWLTIDSNCIDAADGSFAPWTDILDLERVDINDVNNTGVGDPNYADMGAYELVCVWYVDNSADSGGDGESWATAFKYLQDAIDTAGAGDEIWVAQGTYYPDCNETTPTGTNDRQATFQLIEGASLYGGFSGSEAARFQRDRTVYETILSGDINTPEDINDNSYHVVTGANDVTLDGFTIAYGNASITTNNRDKGAGMYNISCSSLRIKNCTFSDNTAGIHQIVTGYGAGMYNDQSSPTLVNCNFSRNYAKNMGSGGAVYNSYYCSPVLVNCLFSDNWAHQFGGGMYNEGYWGECTPTVTNCTFSGNSANYDSGGGMYNYYSSPILTNCTFSGNQAKEYGGGIYNSSNSSPALTNCSFIGNSTTGSTSRGGAVSNNTDTSNPTIISCIFSGNSSYKGGAIHNTSCSPTIINSTFSKNSAEGSSSARGGGMYNEYSDSSPTVTNCIFWANTSKGDGNEIYNYISANPHFSFCDIQDSNGSGAGWWDALGIDDGNNIDSKPNFADVNDPAGPDGLFATFDDGLRLQTNSPCIDAADGNAAPPTDMIGLERIDVNDVNNTGGGDPNYADIGAYELPVIWFVDINAAGGNGTSWADAFDDLQDALAVASDGGEIWVAEGIYTPADDSNRAVSFEMVEGVVMHGGFDGNEMNWKQQDTVNNVTVLSGDIGTPNVINDNSYHVLIGADGAVLNGLTITRGNADGSGADGYGAGIYCYEVSPTIQNCVVTDNNSSSCGAGMYNNYYSSPTLTNCAFTDNYAPSGAGVYNEYRSTPSLTNCSFVLNNADSGAGIYNSNSSSAITNCFFLLNYADSGAGIYNSSSSPAVTSCVLYLNDANSGGGIYNNNSSPKIHDSFLCYNFSESGSGIYNAGSSPVVTNCVLSDNLADVDGGGIYNRDSSSPSMVNCSLTGNTAEFGGGMFSDDSSPALTNCIFWANDANDSGKQIYNNSAAPAFSFCDIQDSNGSGSNWDDNLGIDDGNNIDSDPNFKDIYDPLGSDGIFGTLDDGLRLKAHSPCIDAANGDLAPSLDIIDLPRVDINDVNTGGGDPNYADIGAYESYWGVDDDEDGMWTDWELWYGFDPEDDGDADDDPDRDGYTNLWEFIYDSDPLNSESVPDFDPESLPYQTSFEMGGSMGFDGGFPDRGPQSIDGQNNWKIYEGDALVDWIDLPSDPNYFYQYARVDPYGTAFATFDDTGYNHDYIRLNIWPDCWSYIEGSCATEHEVRIKYGASIIAAVKFGGSSFSYPISVWDGSGYVNSGVDWTDSSGWRELVFEMDWGGSAPTYNVYWDGNSTPIYTDANFGINCDYLTTIELKGGYAPLRVDCLSISNEPTTGGTDDDFDITEPDATDFDLKLEGKVQVEGSAWWNRMVAYELMVCPVDPDIDENNPNNWRVIDGYWRTVVKNDFLGEWDTSLFPNGYYLLGIAPYYDIYSKEEGPLSYAPPGLPAFVVNLEIWVDEIRYYKGWKYFPVVGDLKANTFYHQEEPDISVPWPGEFPFEVRRAYNNNRRLHTLPLRNGWTQNNQMILIEDSNFHWEPIEGTQHLYPGHPAGDERQIAFGHIWVTYPDGTQKMFRHTDGFHSDGGGSYCYFGDTYYYPYPDDGSGEYIIRTTDTDPIDPSYLLWMKYELYTREGLKLVYRADNLAPLEIETALQKVLDTGAIFDRIVAPLQNMTDRLGNKLRFKFYEFTRDPLDVWRVTSAVTKSIRYHRDADDDVNSIGIVFTLDDNDEYYTSAELRIGDVHNSDANKYDEYRWVYYQWDDTNDIFEVIKEGYGVDANGDYDPCNVKQYFTQYQYDANSSLVKIAYDEDINMPSIEVGYDGYGRVAIRKDYVDPNNYLATDFVYTLYYPDANNKAISYLETDANTPYRLVRTIQDGKGNVLEQHTVTSDDSAVIDVNCFYDDYYNPRKPTDVNEYFDGFVKRTQNAYNSAGDLLEQKVYVDAADYISKEMTYHTVSTAELFCVLNDKVSSYQDLNKSGTKVQTKYVYGDANGTPNPDSGVYLVEERVLLSGDPCDTNDVWAVTKYEYDPNARLVIKRKDPNNFISFYEYDENHYKKWERSGTADSNEPVRRFYYDEIGQLLLTANHVGGVTLNDYDEFGRLYEVRTYDDPNAFTKPDVNFVPWDYNDLMSPTSTTIYGYDERGNRTYQKKLPCGCGELAKEYTISGLVKKITYPADGSNIEYTYDDRGLKTREDSNDITSGLTWHVEFTYDSMDRPNDTTWYDYDGSTVVKRVASEYYGCGKEKYEDIYGYDNTLEKQTDYYYNVLGRLNSVVVAPGDLDLTTSYDYDAVGNLISTTDPNGNILYSDYDNANRRIREYFAAEQGTDPNVKQGISYYENNLVKDVNYYDYDGGLLARTEYEYDARRRATKVTQKIDDTNESVTVYDYNDTGFIYDGNEYQERITDANDKITYRAFDAFGRRVRTMYPSGDYEELEYNGDGTLSTRTAFNPAGDPCQIEYYYDSSGRMTDVNYPDGGNIHYSYDGFGRKTLVEDNRNADDKIGGTNQIAYDYDVLGRIVAVAEQNNYKIIYTYRGDGQKATIDVDDTIPSTIYSVEYYYDTAGRLANVNEPLLGTDDLIAEFEYDDNGNRKKLTYCLEGTSDDNSVSIIYTYNLDNLLAGYSTSSQGVTGPTFGLTDVNVDGLSRLTDANENITKTDGNSVSHLLRYEYDMLSELTDANISNIDGNNWAAQYVYKKNGDMTSRTIQSSAESFSYDGHLMTDADGNSLSWDENGNMIIGVDVNLVYNWDNKLRYADSGSDYMSLKYDPSGNRIFKDSSEAGQRKYIIDIVGDLPVILLELDTSNNIKKTYIYANSQIIAQHDGNDADPMYFYMHDRLGSVRQVIDPNGDVVRLYTYEPFGKTLEDEGSLGNSFMFAGQTYDSEIDEYYLRARQYDPVIGRFTSRDPVCGDFKEPMTLHVYLYCLNDPINRTDPTGELWGALRYAYRVVHGVSAYYTALDVGLKMAGGDPWRTLNVAIQVNVLREYLFDPETLNKPFAWEIALRNLPSEIAGLISGACDWGRLGDCLAPVATEFLATTLIKEATGYKTVGKAICVACAIEPTKALCIPCVGYIAIEAISNAKTINAAIGCFRTHCGN